VSQIGDGTEAKCEDGLILHNETDGNAKVDADAHDGSPVVVLRPVFRGKDDLTPISPRFLRFLTFSKNGGLSAWAGVERGMRKGPFYFSVPDFSAGTADVAKTHAEKNLGQKNKSRTIRNLFQHASGSTQTGSSKRALLTWVLTG
jgi:hypothetical protein